MKLKLIRSAFVVLGVILMMTVVTPVAAANEFRLVHQGALTLTEGISPPDPITFTLLMYSLVEVGTDVNVTATATNECYIAEGGVGAGDSFTTRVVTARGFTDAQNVPHDPAFVVRAYDDTIAQGAHTCSISFTVQSTNTTYDGATVDPVQFTVLDNDSAAGGTSTPSSGTTVSAAPTPPADPAAPSPLTSKSISLEGPLITEKDGIKTFKQGSPLTIKSKTVPGGKVTLYIFSTPRVVTVTADAQGDWSYDITGLESGAHHIEAEVTNPAGAKSVRSSVAKFNVAAEAQVQGATIAKSAGSAAVKVMASTMPTKEHASRWWLWVAGLVLLVIGIVIFWWLRTRSKKRRTAVRRATAATKAAHQSRQEIARKLVYRRHRRI